MVCSLNLWQISCAYPCLDFAGWCSASRRGLSNEFSYDQLESLINLPETNSIFMAKLRWRALWKKIIREKRKFFKSSVLPARFPYDPFSYAQTSTKGRLGSKLKTYPGPSPPDSQFLPVGHSVE